MKRSSNEKTLLLLSHDDWICPLLTIMSRRGPNVLKNEVLSLTPPQSFVSLPVSTKFSSVQQQVDDLSSGVGGQERCEDRTRHARGDQPL